MSRVYICSKCNKTVSKFFLHKCSGIILKAEESQNKTKPRAADDVDSIRARLAELQKEREEAQEKANKDEADAQAVDNSASCLNLSIGDVVNVIGFGTVPCVIADIQHHDYVIIIWHDGAGHLCKKAILRKHITRKITKL